MADRIDPQASRAQLDMRETTRRSDAWDELWRKLLARVEEALDERRGEASSS